MTINFMAYGLYQTPETSLEDQVEDQLDERIDDLQSRADDLDEKAGSIEANLEALEAGLKMLEDAGNHNTKVASDEFKKVEREFNRTYERLKALESKGGGSADFALMHERFNKVVRTFLTRDEVQGFVDSTRSRLHTLESTALTDSDVKDFVDNMRSRVAQLENDKARLNITVASQEKKLELLKEEMVKLMDRVTRLDRPTYRHRGCN